MFWLVKTYSRIYGVVKDTTGRNLPGLGRVLRSFSRDEILMVHGFRVFLDGRIADCYGRLVAGAWNEPETHTFLSRVIDRHPRQVQFVDVGANVGEFVVHIASMSNVGRVTAFEPIPEAANVIRVNALLNAHSHIEVIEAAATNRNGVAKLGVSRDLTNSSLGDAVAERQITVDTVRLDDFVWDAEHDLVMLLDVEGEELNVVRGASRTIADRRPLIIFEYNHVSRTRFSLAEMQDELGPGYVVRALLPDSSLGSADEVIWNCVAVPNVTDFNWLIDESAWETNRQPESS